MLKVCLHFAPAIPMEVNGNFVWKDERVPLQIAETAGIILGIIMHSASAVQLSCL